MVAFLAAQLNVSPSVLDEYADRSRTRTDHLAEATEALGFRAPGIDDLAHLGACPQRLSVERRYPALVAFLSDTATRLTEETVELFDRALFACHGRPELETNGARPRPSRVAM